MNWVNGQYPTQESRFIYHIQGLIKEKSGIVELLELVGTDFFTIAHTGKAQLGSQAGLSDYIIDGSFLILFKINSIYLQREILIETIRAIRL